MRGYLIGGAVGALAIASVAAAAQPAPPPPGVAQGTAPAPMAPMSPPGAPHVRMMLGGDHVMTRDEVAKHVGELFARLDTNRDGFVTKDEVEAIHARMAAAMAKAGDAEHRVGDIEKHLAERGVFIGNRGAMFDRLDSNHDGNVSRQEFMASKPQVHEERVMIMRGPDGAAGAPGMHGMHAMGGMHAMHMGGTAMGQHMFEMADANHDGRVSLAKVQAAALAHFDKADVNHDGRITPDERVEIRLERHEHGVN
jgi:Ca2+-binding EF-hand superfamily protein